MSNAVLDVKQFFDNYTNTNNWLQVTLTIQ